MRLVIFLLLAATVVRAQTLRINNLQPRLDVAGKPVDAHDGRITQFGNKFYWYGTRYGNTNGFTTANEYVVYSSPDMMRWTLEGPLLANKPEGVYYRPHVVFNIATKKYVLWYNWYPKLWDGKFGVATSDSPTGPFAILTADAKVKHSNLGVGDLSVFVDADAQAYLSYNTIRGHQVCVEKLDANYTASTGQASDFLARDCEAGSMFKRNGYYHLLTDYTCCFCTQGSGARVFRSKNILGPYEWVQNINRWPGDALPALTDGQSRNGLYHSIAPGAYLLLENTGGKPISALTAVAYTADRKGQCGQVNEPKVHEPILAPSLGLEFETENGWRPLPLRDSAIQLSAINASVTYRFAPTTVGRIRVRNLSTAPMQLAELSAQKIALQAYTFAAQGGRPVIPGQQTHVMELNTRQGKQYLWMADMWGSALDGVKGHDLQFWSRPLRFDAQGKIERLQWVDSFSIVR